MHFDEQGTPTDFTYLYTNPSFHQQTGLPPVVGRQVSEAIPGIEVSDRWLLEVYGRVVRSGIAERFEQFVAALEDWFAVEVVPAGGDCFIAIFNVVTAVRQAREEHSRLLRHQQAIRDAALVGFIEVQDCCFRQCNAAFEAMLGWGPGELIGQSVCVVFPNEATCHAIEAAIRDGGVFCAEQELMRKDGEACWVSLHMVMLREGTPVVLGIAIDISERHRLSVALQRHADELAMIINASPTPQAINDADGNVVFVNQAFTDVFGYVREDIPTLEHWWQVAYPDAAYRDFVRNCWQRQVAVPSSGGQSGDAALYAVTTKAGDARQVLISAAHLAGSLAGNTLVTLVDVSALKEAESRLIESEARFRHVFEFSPVGLAMTVLPDCTFVEVNDAFCQLLGRPPEAMIGRSPVDIGVWADPSDRDAFYAELGRQGQLRNVYGRFVKGDGAPFDGLISGCILVMNGRPHLLAAVTDISEVVEARARLEASEARYRELVEGQSDLIASMSPQGVMTFVNEAFCRFFGTVRECVLGTHWQPLAHPEDRAMVEARLGEMTVDRPTVVVENRVIAGSGAVRWVQFVNHGRFDPDGGLVEVQSVARDITERKLIEFRLAESNRKLVDLTEHQAAELRKAALSLAEAEQQERGRLHHLLHDDIQPLLVAGRLALSSLPSDRLEITHRHLVLKAIQHIGDALTGMRSLSRELSPPLIREHGLVAALTGLVEWVDANLGFSASFQCREPIQPVAEGVALTVYHGVRELLLNVAKHAQAQSALVCMQLVDDSRLQVTVLDDGKGMGNVSLPVEGGLELIRRRIGYLGGELRVAAGMWHGTRVTIELPLNTSESFFSQR